MANGEWIRRKTCMITGATSGIGRASALELGKMGAKLILVCRNRERGNELMREIHDAGNSGNIVIAPPDRAIEGETECRRPIDLGECPCFVPAIVPSHAHKRADIAA